MSVAGEGIRAVLMNKRSDLLALMAGLSAAPSDAGGISFGKRVGDGTSMAVERLTQVAAHEKALEQLAEVDRALAKLDDGSYGRKGFVTHALADVLARDKDVREVVAIGPIPMMNRPS